MDATRVTRTWRLLLSAALVLAIVGCTHTQAVGAARTLNIALSEFRLTPQRVSVSAGPLTLSVRNFGQLAHNLAVIHGGRIIAVTKPIPPGTTRKLTVDLAPGNYSTVSTLFDDESLGIHGSLVVSG